MGKWRDRAWSGAVFAGMALVAAPAAAYIRYQTPNGSGFAWNQSCVPIVAFPGGFSQMTAAEVQGAAVGAAAAWSAAANSCTFLDLEVALSTASAPHVGNDGINALLFQTSSWCELDSVDDCLVQYDPAAIEVTTTTAVMATGQIVDADIEVNAFNFSWADVVAHPDLADHQDLQNALTRAFGHLIGLDQSCYDPKSGLPRPLDDTGQPAVDCDQASPALQATTMFPSYAPGDTQRRTLAPDDQAGLCAIYPLGADPASCLASAGMCVCSTGDGGAPSDAGQRSDAGVEPDAGSVGGTGARGAQADAAPTVDASRRSAAAGGCSYASGKGSPPPEGPIALGVGLMAVALRRRRREKP
jgi:hypothetical protein